MEILSDKALMEKVQNGQTDALGLLFERYKALLYSFFYQMTRDGVYSEDMVQNVFMRILKYKKQYKGSGSFKSWMFSIARNAATDLHRKKSKRRTDDIEDYQEVFIEEDDPEKRLHMSESQQLLHRALAQMEDSKRELIVLVKLNEMKYREVAELMNMNESTLKVKVFRCMKELKEIYSKMANVA